ncbi:Uncharacterized protein BWINRASL_02149 [Bacillus mycoides]|nr:Uncharacterized protein BWINRASL_02149 [Bacillus mycoides]
MFWLGSFVGYVVGSFITCAVFYFCFKAEQNKKAEIERRMLDESVKKKWSN